MKDYNREMQFMMLKVYDNRFANGQTAASVRYEFTNAIYCYTGLSFLLIDTRFSTSITLKTAHMQFDNLIKLLLYYKIVLLHSI